MMKLWGLLVTARGMFDDHRSTFGFDALPFVRVVLFPSSSLVGVVLFPSSAHWWNWTGERIRRGRYSQKGYF